MKTLLIILTQFTINLSSFAQSTTIDDNSCHQEPDTLDGLRVYKIVEHQPEYSGGMNKFYRELSALIKYPNSEKIPVESKFIFTFVIDTLGNIRNLCLIKPDNGLYINEEKLDQLSKWIPGLQNGKKVPVRILVPVIVELD